MLRRSVILWLLCLPFLLAAQKKAGKENLDSLLKELPAKKDDSTRVNLLHTIGMSYMLINPVSGKKYAEDALSLAIRINYKNGIAGAYDLLGALASMMGNDSIAVRYDSIALKMFEDSGDSAKIAGCIVTLGIIYAQRADYLQGLAYFRQALALFERLHNKAKVATCHTNIGNIYYYLGNYPEALNSYFSALKISEEIGAKDGIANSYTNIGMLYTEQKNNVLGLKYDSMALSMNRQLGNRQREGGVLQNMAGVYCNEDKNYEALDLYREALAIYRETGDSTGVADCYLGFANIYFELGRLPETIDNYETALKRYQQTGDRQAVAKAFIYMGKTFARQKKYAEAIKNINGGLVIANEIGALHLVESGNDALSTLYTETGQFQKALECYKIFVKARDSLFNDANTQKTVRMQMQYDFEKKESLAKEEQARKEAVLSLKLERKNVLIYGTLSALAGLLIIGVLALRQNRLRMEKQKTELEQKQLRAQMNPHFIFNCLNSIQHFVVANDVKNANKYLSGFALLMRQTLENSKQGVITLRREMEYLENYLLLEKMRFEDKFTAEVTCSGDVNKDMTEIPAMIIQPFIENAIRHGLCYLEGKQGLLKVSFYINGGFLYCSVDDNGIGRERSQQLKMASETVYESQGMELTRQRLALVSKSAGAEYKIEIIDKKDADDQPEGTTVIIKFPLET